MQTQTLISLLIPVYKVAPYIERCAQGLFSQSYRNLEYIFVDDCSPDESIDLLKSVLADYPARAEQVTIIRHSRNEGLAAARNTAIGKARGTWVLFADSDDWIEPDAVERLAAPIADGVDMVCCDYYAEYPDRQLRQTQKQTANSGIEWLRTQAGGGGIGWALWNKLLRRTLFTDHELRFIPGANMGEDLGMTIRLACHIRGIRHITVPLIHYRLREDSFSFNHYADGIQEGLYRNLCCGLDYLKEQGLLQVCMPEIARLALRYKSDRLRESGLRYQGYITELLPEAHKYLWSGAIRLSLMNRLIVTCGIHNQKLLLALLRSLSRLALQIRTHVAHQ